MAFILKMCTVVHVTVLQYQPYLDEKWLKNNKGYAKSWKIVSYMMKISLIKLKRSSHLEMLVQKETIILIPHEQADLLQSKRWYGVDD